MPAPRKLHVLTGGELPRTPTDKEELESCVDELNQTHAMVMLGGKCLVLNEIVDPVFNRPDFTLSAPADFKIRYANKKIFLENDKGEVKSRCAADIWLQHSRRRDYQGIVFAPGEEVPGFYNLYRGFAFEPKQGRWDRFKAHIAEIVCGCDAHIFDYLIAWMADSVQDPGGVRPGVSIVMRGGRGTGKGLFARAFGELFGGHFLHITHPSQLTGKFNNHQKDALMLFGDECFWAGDKTCEGVLKGMITEPTIRVEPKGRDPFVVKNHMRLMISSNESWVVPAGLEERRFLVLDVENTRKQSSEYFAPIYEELKQGGHAAMLHELLNYRYEKKKLFSPPRTGALLSQIEEGMELTHKYWFERLRAGRILKSQQKWEETVVSDKMYEEFSAFGKTLGYNHCPSPSAFGRRLRKVCSDITRGKLWTSHTDYQYGLKFPSLEECRDAFERALGQSVNWDDGI